MTRKYKALALGAGFAAALALSACGRHHHAPGTAPPAEAPPATSAPAQGGEGTMGAPAESGAPATSSPSANPGG
jgi:hypothetical protein